MNCPNCGADNREGARFCRRCGKELVEASLAEASPEVAVEEAPPDELPSQTEAEAEGGEAESEAGLEEMPLEQPMPEERDVELETVALHAEGEDDEAVVEVEGEEPVVEAEEEESVVEAEEEMAVEAEAEGEDIEPGTGASEESTEDERVEEAPTPPEWLEEDQAEEAEPLPGPGDDDLAFWREEAEPLAPATPGTVIADRYVLTEVLDEQGNAILYHAHDMQRCWQCDFEGNDPDDAFCAQCGASLDRMPSVHLLEVKDAEDEPPTDMEVAARLAHKGRDFLLLQEPEPQDSPVARDLRLLVGQRSDAGLVRELDEDSLLAMTLAPTYESRTGPVLGLFAVADGMGGHEGGEVASKLALQVLATQVMQTIVLPELAGELALDEDIIGCLRQATMAANDQVYLARQKRENDMGTTLTAILVRGERLFLIHVGDCRAYRWNADGLEQLTTDHSVVASMIASGRAEPEEIYTHPHRSVIYRCIGDTPTVQVDTDILPLAAGDRIIVCCDGLWEMIRNEGIEDVMMQEADPQAACDLLVKHANVAGGEDNISVIVVQVEAV
jgi:serine/threonine protein phosphatase PrpC